MGAPASGHTCSLGSRRSSQNSLACSRMSSLISVATGDARLIEEAVNLLRSTEFFSLQGSNIYCWLLPEQLELLQKAGANDFVRQELEDLQMPRDPYATGSDAVPIDSFISVV